MPQTRDARAAQGGLKLAVNFNHSRGRRQTDFPALPSTSCGPIAELTHVTQRRAFSESGLEAGYAELRRRRHSLSLPVPPLPTFLWERTPDFLEVPTFHFLPHRISGKGKPHCDPGRDPGQPFPSCCLTNPGETALSREPPTAHSPRSRVDAEGPPAELWGDHGALGTAVALRVRGVRRNQGRGCFYSAGTSSS